jgi:hypothetical protein
MGLTIKFLDNAISIIKDSECTILTEDDMHHAWCVTARLYDNNFIGPTIIEFSSNTYVLDEHEWGLLYDLTSKYIDRCFITHFLEGC